MQQRSDEFKPPSLVFAWNIAGDYFLTMMIIRRLEKAQEERPQGLRRGAMPVCDPEATARLWAGGHKHKRQAPASQDSQEY